MPQERYNTQWLRERGLGLVIRSLESCRGGRRDGRPSLSEFATRPRARIDNRAVFEVPDILAILMIGSPYPPQSPGEAHMQIARLRAQRRFVS